MDDNSNITTYDVNTKAVLFQAQGANSVSWNTEFNDMLCYTGSNTLSIKTASFPLHQQKLNVRAGDDSSPPCASLFPFQRESACPSSLPA